MEQLDKFERSGKFEKFVNVWKVCKVWRDWKLRMIWKVWKIWNSQEFEKFKKKSFEVWVIWAVWEVWKARKVEKRVFFRKCFEVTLAFGVLDRCPNEVRLDVSLKQVSSNFRRSSSSKAVDWVCKVWKISGVRKVRTTWGL